MGKQETGHELLKPKVGQVAMLAMAGRANGDAPLCRGGV